MKHLIVIGSVLLILASCNKSEVLNRCESEEGEVTYPICFQPFIDLALSTSPTSPRATIKRYSYNGECIYEVSIINVPDGGGSYQTSECKIVCGWGGLLGETTCTSEFIENIEFVEMVWIDVR